MESAADRSAFHAVQMDPDGFAGQFFLALVPSIIKQLVRKGQLSSFHPKTLRMKEAPCVSFLRFFDLALQR